MAKKKDTKGYPYRQRFVMVIDLENDSFSKVELTQSDAQKYLGGRSLALKLWEDYSESDKLKKEFYESGNAVVIAPGAACDQGLEQFKSVSIVSFSEQSNGLSISSFSSIPLVYALSGLGCSALVIKNRSRRLSRIDMNSDGVSFANVEEMHLMKTDEVEIQGGSATCIVSIGPAGELGVPYASLVINGKNYTRGGVGAVLGNKNLKMLCLDASEIVRPLYYENRGEDLHKFLALLPQQRDNFLPESNAQGWAAIEGFRYRKNPRLWGLGGNERTADCTLDWEIALALGANLGFYDWEHVALLERATTSYGLDPITMGIVLLWILTAEEKGLIDLNVDASLNRYERCLKIIEGIGLGKGSFSKFSFSVATLCEKYGNQEYNFTSYHKELWPFDFRGLQTFAVAVAVDDDTLVPCNLFKHIKRKKIASSLFMSQCIRRTLESLGLDWNQCIRLLSKSTCSKHFVRTNKIFQNLALCLSVSEGYEWTPTSLFQFGKRALFEELRLVKKYNSSYSPSNDRIPEYFQIESDSSYESADVVKLGGILADYLSLLSLEFREFEEE